MRIQSGRECSVKHLSPSIHVHAEVIEQCVLAASWMIDKLEQKWRCGDTVAVASKSNRAGLWLCPAPTE